MARTTLSSSRSRTNLGAPSLNAYCAFRVGSHELPSRRLVQTNLGCPIHRAVPSRDGWGSHELPSRRLAPEQIWVPHPKRVLCVQGGIARTTSRRLVPEQIWGAPSIAQSHRAMGGMHEPIPQPLSQHGWCPILNAYRAFRVRSHELPSRRLVPEQIWVPHPERVLCV